MKLQKLIHTLIPILCCWLLPNVQAVVPPPDGGYPGGNTAEGQNALLSLTTGGFNTAVGFFSLKSDTAGGFNTAVGAATLLSNTGDENTAVGTAALLLNTTGSDNTAVGVSALLNNDDGTDNTATGFGALQTNTTGGLNTAIGSNALVSNATGHDNTATGANALFSNVDGVNNTAVGSNALHQNASGGLNTAIGFNALRDSTGNQNIALGQNAGLFVTTASGVICIGSGGQNVDDSCFINHIFGVTSSGGTPVVINNQNKLGTATSSRRFKEQIKPMERASEALFALEPVSFRYKEEIDPAGTSQFGLVAEEVEKVNPDLIVRDKEGMPYSVRYDQVNAMLLNEFLKEHRKGEEQDRKILKQEAAIAKQEKQIDALKQELKEQRALVEKVNARIEMDNAASRLAVDKL